MFVFDFVQVGGESTNVATWIDGNRPRLSELAAMSWEQHHGLLPVGLDSAGPFAAAVGFPVMSGEAVRFPISWSIGLTPNLVVILAAELSVQPFLGGAVHIELQGSCRELVGWMTELENDHARKVMLAGVRSFMASLVVELERVAERPIETSE